MSTSDSSTPRRSRSRMMPWREASRVAEVVAAEVVAETADGPETGKLFGGQKKALPRRKAEAGSAMAKADAAMNAMGHRKIRCAEDAPRSMSDLPEAFRKPTRPPTPSPATVLRDSFVDEVDVNTER